MNDLFRLRMTADGARLNLANYIKGIMYPDQICYDIARIIQTRCECYLAACDEYVQKLESEQGDVDIESQYKSHDTPTNLYHD